MHFSKAAITLFFSAAAIAAPSPALKERQIFPPGCDIGVCVDALTAALPHVVACATAAAANGENIVADVECVVAAVRSEIVLPPSCVDCVPI